MCLGSAVKPIPQQADDLARLHSALRSGKPAQVSSLTTLQSHTQDSLRQRAFSPSPDGNCCQPAAQLYAARRSYEHHILPDHTSFSPLTEASAISCTPAAYLRLSRCSDGAAGTMLISETFLHLRIYKLVLSQPLSLKEIAALPLPDRHDDDGDAACLRSVTWAPDSSMVLILWDSWLAVRDPAITASSPFESTVC